MDLSFSFSVPSDSAAICPETLRKEMLTDSERAELQSSSDQEARRRVAKSKIVSEIVDDVEALERSRVRVFNEDSLRRLTSRRRQDLFWLKSLLKEGLCIALIAFLPFLFAEMPWYAGMSAAIGIGLLGGLVALYLDGLGKARFKWCDIQDNKTLVSSGTDLDAQLFKANWLRLAYYSNRNESFDYKTVGLKLQNDPESRKHIAIWFEVAVVAKSKKSGREYFVALIG